MMDGEFYLLAASYGPALLWATPAPRGFFAPLTSPQRWVKYHFFFFFFTMRWSWKQIFIVLLETQISPMMMQYEMQIHKQHQSTWTIKGWRPRLRASLNEPLQLCKFKSKMFYGVFPGRNVKCSCRNGLPQHSSYPSTMGLAPPFYLQKMAQKMIMNHLLTASLRRSQAKGLNPLAKSSFAAANTTAYYSLICPDPGLMQDSPRLEQRVERGGNHFIISVAPLELSQGIWKANSRRKVELLGLMNGATAAGACCHFQSCSNN